MASYQLEDLLYLMGRLRDPQDGCPWDRQQNFASIAPHTLEEVYELVDCLEKGDYGHLREELGDVLFQVVFYAQLGQEQSLFGFADIVSELVEKLLRRHPHVFPGGQLSHRAGEVRQDEEEIRGTWEKIKQQERNERLQEGVFDDIATALPALGRSVKLQQRAAKSGFDWPDAEAVVPKVEEELAEVLEAVENQDRDAIEDELGDLLFAVTNLARKLKVDPEAALRRANRKFSRRFEGMNSLANKAGKSFQQYDLEGQTELWEAVKLMEKG
ncbi:ATP diphosphatase [Sinobacterium caligoides]|uniref:Nucleoside triphosphate pyrophosphohydrolase n=1 Tax=Sinobacterium caligoides TaxID=933926 RepID=A0A3N2DY17_9GAMM|nr:nucleoside triphosphate pyrophosphohydrolase [Sinobacterium caligoides]ROS04708.1 ATP diphosphatase [Sinobacterium caligoides]